jgi:hypothetical protein
MNDENEEKVRVIFLDIDGVLNGFNRFTYFLYKIFAFFNLDLWFLEKVNIFGIQTEKIRILRRIQERTRAIIVLCSAYRFSWYQIPYEQQRKICKDFSLHCYKNNIEISSITPRLSSSYNREDEVNTWIMNNNSIVKSFIILDDDLSLYPHLKTNHCVNIQTRPYKMGLRYNHIKESLDLFHNQENRMD